jgi:hypothetical protein
MYIYMYIYIYIYIYIYMYVYIYISASVLGICWREIRESDLGCSLSARCVCLAAQRSACREDSKTILPE